MRRIPPLVKVLVLSTIFTVFIYALMLGKCTFSFSKIHLSQDSSHRRKPYLYSKSYVQALKESLPDGVWDEFIDHPFVRGMADGTLSRESFIFYIKQDYLYLQHYARSAALAAYKCRFIMHTWIPSNLTSI